MEAMVASHKVERLLALVAAPRSAFVLITRRIALRILASMAYHVAPLESAFTFAERTHSIVFEAERVFAFDAKEVEELIRASFTGNIFESSVGELMAK